MIFAIIAQPYLQHTFHSIDMPAMTWAKPPEYFTLYSIQKTLDIDLCYTYKCECKAFCQLTNQSRLGSGFRQSVKRGAAARTI